MKIPTLEHLERALHLRGAIAAVQAELAAVLNGLSDIVAPEEQEAREREPKGPFADAAEGARARRLWEREKKRKPKKRRSPSRVRSRKPPEDSPRQNRLWSLLSGGEVGTAPAAAETKRKRPSPRKPLRSRRRKTISQRRRKPPRRRAVP